MSSISSYFRMIPSDAKAYYHIFYIFWSTNHCNKLLSVHFNRDWKLCYNAVSICLNALVHNEKFLFLPVSVSRSVSFSHVIFLSKTNTETAISSSTFISENKFTNFAQQVLPNVHGSIHFLNHFRSSHMDHFSTIHRTEMNFSVGVKFP